MRMKRVIRVLCVPLAISLSLLLAPSCQTTGGCTDCEVAGAACENCAGTEACQAAGGTCEECPGAGCVVPEKILADANGCAGCAVLMEGGTGWCADCGTGYSGGFEVHCNKVCSSSPGAEPCSSCAK